MKQNGNTILVTGGGSGIGEALAQRFHDKGNTVIVAGRRRVALEHACEGRENKLGGNRTTSGYLARRLQ